ncbi:DUF6801 domain-containing protein [Streptomyces sp. NPDC001904]|uniref:DUF6801 domain-containing protein n=1 Tax=Streptomyces sp. NPDC001904 TaxID=3154531 RepID=UPI003325A8B3
MPAVELPLGGGRARVSGAERHRVRAHDFRRQDRMNAIGKRTGLRARRSVRVASVASAALVAGLLSGSGSRADEKPPSSVELGYQCSLPATTETDATAATKLTTTVKVSTQLPTTAVTGQPIQAGPVQVEAALPRAGLASLLPSGADVTSEASLAVEVRQNEDKATTTWSGLDARATMPADGEELVLPYTGDVSSITVNSTGDIELFAGDLALTLTPSSGAPVTVSCSPSDPEPQLARVAVPGGDETEPGDSPSSSATPGDGKGESRDGVTVAPKDEPKADEVTCGPRPTGEPDISQAPPPPIPAEAEPVIGGGFGGCAYAAGLATVRKQNGSMIINDPSASPALMNVSGAFQAVGVQDPVTGDQYSRYDSIAKLSLPDADSTFLSFGFVPVSAKVAFTTGMVSISTGNLKAPFDAFAAVTFMQSLRIKSVKVNGTTLPVGPNCHTKDFRVTLRGIINDDGSGTYTNVLFGGLLTGKVTIPEFTGCGTGGENLNPLFTAAISGPDNQISMNQAMVCAPEYGFGCPPAMPTLPPIKTP